MTNTSLTTQIKNFALSLGFDACGISKAEIVDEQFIFNYQNWINDNKHADMDYLARNSEKRFNPCNLVENAKSIISVILNYYPQQKQPETAPQIAYYAYGKDYHDVVKSKLENLLFYIRSILPDVQGRAFCDTAPILERYWASRAGLGFIGKNTLLITPKKGSYFFIGELIIDQVLNYDQPLNNTCGSCTRCLEACPTKAIEKPYQLNACNCISYQTIENKGEIATHVQQNIGNHFYGCDVCQQVCPWNRFATGNSTAEFVPSQDFLALDQSSIENMSVEQYQRIFKGSAMKRAKYSGLMRNIKAIKSK